MTRKDGTERDATRRNWAELGGTGLDGTRALPHQSVYGVTDKPQRGDGRTIDERVAPPLPAKAQGAVVPARIHRPQQTHTCQLDKIEVAIEQWPRRVAASQQQDRAAQARARHSVGTRDSNLRAARRSRRNNKPFTAPARRRFQRPYVPAERECHRRSNAYTRLAFARE